MPNSVAVSKDLMDFLDSLPEPRLVLGTDYRIIGSNLAYQKIFGEGKSITGKHCYEVSHHYLKPCDQQGEACPLKEARETKTSHRVFHIHHTPRGREHIDVELTPILGSNGEPAFYIETLRKQQHISVLPSQDSAVGKSPEFVRMLGLVERVAPSDTPALLLGESGTGKEVIAHILHKKSKRSSSGFVIVDCSGLTETLFESEMFGHEKGSFTGAYSDKKGLVEMSYGGTLFLDEVGEIPLTQQVKLLRLIEANTYRRVGGTEVLRANFRLICATHRNLKAMVEAGTFRQDLYFRINAFPIFMPALRERPGDICLLAESLLNKLSPNKKYLLSPDANDFISEYTFPGNIRELRNMLERAILLADTDIIKSHHLMDESHASISQYQSAQYQSNFHGEIIPLDKLESRYLQWAVSESSERKKEVAAKLGLTPRTFYRKLRCIANKN
jgi:two-component system response regulator HydG